MTNYIGFIFRLKLICPDCNNAIPINRIIDKVNCHNCSTKINLPPFWWKANIFNMTLIIKARRSSEGKMFSESRLHGDIKYDYKLGRRFPRCQICNVKIASNEKWNVEDIMQTLGNSEYIHCKKCHHPMTIRLPDNFIKSATNFKVHAILGEDPKSLDENKHKGNPMKFACLNCGAGLKADGSERVVTCNYCNTDNFLPTELWRRLNPIPKPKSFFLLADI